MTDFVSRMAARAVGRAPLAQPTLPATFEPEPAPEPPGPTSEAGARPLAAQTGAPTAAGDGLSLATHTPELADALPAGPAQARRAEEPEPSSELPPAAAARNEAPRATSHRPVLADSDAGILPAAEATAAASPPEPAVTPVVVARPVVSAAALVGASPAAAAAAPATAAAVEPPAVRVHIGRLEVRANLQPPALERPRRGAPRPKELGLSDYLRGGRAPS